VAVYDTSSASAMSTRTPDAGERSYSQRRGWPGRGGEDLQTMAVDGVADHRHERMSIAA
jgi:hypothetical protein